jgi:hypothetical protein
MIEGRTSTRARSWQEMYAQVQAQLERQTGETLAGWKAKVAAAALPASRSCGPGSPSVT